jgi:high-affinity iron transporter
VDFGAFTSGLLTGLREGVEAALIVSIVITYLVRTGRGEQIGRVWVGTGLAAVLSLVVGVVIFNTVGAFEEPWEQIFEGTTLLIAAGVVTWMLFWMRRQARSVKGELQAAVERAIAAGSSWGLAILAFTAVIREGLETSIFLVGQATSDRAEAAWIVIGAVAGLGIAVLIGYGFYRGSHRLNLASFFRWTGIALVFIAAGLLSHGIGEFVEIGALGSGPWTAPAFDISALLSDESGVGSFLRAIFGYSATPAVVTLVAHVVYLVSVLALYLRPMRQPLPPASSTPTTVTARS